MPLLGIVGMMLIGLALIWSSSRERAKNVARRIDKVRGQDGGSGDREGRKRRPEGRVTPQATDQLTEAEHRQIIRAFARLGVPPEQAVAYFKISRLILLICLALAPLPFIMKLFARSPAAGLLAMAAPAVIGYLIPMILVRRSIASRARSVGSGLPDALELLAVCVEAGLSLENGLQRVAAELKRSQPALADELALTWAEINILPNRDQALLNFADRVNIPSVRSVVTTLSQTLRYGTPLARSLRVVAADVREDQLTAMEEKANRLPAMMTVPVMLFIMPTIFLIIGGPAALKLMDIFWGK
jgi:tight adherence protein C